MIMPGEDSTKAERGLRRRPQGKIRTIIYYPLSLGRNFDELLYVIKALQTADHFAVATPADWRPGEPVIVPTAGSCGTAQERMEGHVEGVSDAGMVLLHQGHLRRRGRVRHPGYLGPAPACGSAD